MVNKYVTTLLVGDFVSMLGYLKMLVTITPRKLFNTINEIRRLERVFG